MNYIVIDDDDDIGQGRPSVAPFNADHRHLMNRFWEMGSGRHNAILIDGSDDHGGQVTGIAEFMGFPDDDWAFPNLDNVTRNKVVEDHLRLSTYRLNNGTLIKEGTIVEIKQLSGKDALGVQFIEVQLIRREGSNVLVRGIPFTRTRNLRGRLPLKRNEVVAVLNIHEEDPREWTYQAAIEASVEDVVRTRELQLTNAFYPAHRYDTTAFRPMDAEDRAHLTCRWKMVSIYKSAADEKKNRLLSRTFVRLRAHEIPNIKLRVPDNQLLDRWRGGKIRGGSHRPGAPAAPAAPIIDLTADTNDTPGLDRGKRALGQKYTHADLFCGAGGVTRGAKAAGFKTTIACDLDPNACATYRLNFPGTSLYEMHIHEFATSVVHDLVDTLHLSPPCQVWSPAHTREGRNDEANLAALYACQQVLVKFRPRIVTVEQTFGLLHKRFEHYFNIFLNCFTMTDYSVAYKVTNLSEIGSSQPRKRLTMVASCAGERLPSFPRPSNSNLSGDTLPGVVTVAQALSTIGPRATHHNVDEVLARALNNPSFPKPPYDPNTLLRHTITCGGGDYHPSGDRGFTLREFAALQGFPSHHQFAGRGIRKQIGNAFPPTSVKVLYDHIHAWLLKEDGIKEEADGNNEVEVIVLEDDEQADANHDDDDDDDDDVMMVDWRERSVTMPLEEE